MFKKHFVKREAEDGTGSSSDSGTPPAPQPDIKAMQAEMETLRKQAATLLDEKKKIQKQFEGIDPEKTKAMLAHFESSEEAKLIAEGKIDDVIARRTERRDAEVARQIEEAKAQVEQAKQNATRFHVRLLQGEIKASAPSDHHPVAMEDAMRHAMEVFKLDDEGNIVPKDGRNGKDGKTPYSLKEWFEDTRQTHPHRYANSNSGSSHFDKGGKPGSNTMARSKFDALPPNEKHATIKAGITIVDR